MFVRGRRCDLDFNHCQSPCDLRIVDASDPHGLCPVIFPAFAVDLRIILLAINLASQFFIARVATIRMVIRTFLVAIPKYFVHVFFCRWANAGEMMFATIEA